MFRRLIGGGLLRGGFRLGSVALGIPGFALPLALRFPFCARLGPRGFPGGLLLRPGGLTLGLAFGSALLTLALRVCRLFRGFRRGLFARWRFRCRCLHRRCLRRGRFRSGSLGGRGFRGGGFGGGCLRRLFLPGLTLATLARGLLGAFGTVRGRLFGGFR